MHYSRAAHAHIHTHAHHAHMNNEYDVRAHSKRPITQPVGGAIRRGAQDSRPVCVCAPAMHRAASMVCVCASSVRLFECVCVYARAHYFN